MTLLDLCSYLGLGAVAAVAINLLLGMLIAMRYSPVRLWPHRKINLFLLHRVTAFVALALAMAHPLVLLFLRSPTFSATQVLWPIHSYLQPKLNLAGAVALYLILVVLVSSLLLTRIGRPLWRRLHYLVYPGAVLLFLHSVLTDPELKDGNPDLLDGGKIFLFGSLLVTVAATWIRVRLRGRGLRVAQRAPSP